MSGRTVNLLIGAGREQPVPVGGGGCVVLLMASCICSCHIYPYVLGVMLRRETSTNLSPILSAPVVGAEPKL